MSQGNVDLVRRCYELWSTRDFSAIPEVMDPEIVIDLSRNIFDPAVYRGHHGVRQYVETVEEVWEEFEVSPEEFIDGPDIRSGKRQRTPRRNAPVQYLDLPRREGAADDRWVPRSRGGPQGHRP